MVSEMTLHFGYGSNLWFEQMNARCPDNKRKGRGILKNYKWIIAERPGRGAAHWGQNFDPGAIVFPQE